MAPAQPTLWGLTITQLHDRFWAARGVQVVRQGEPSEIVEGAELFLLTDADSLVIFKLNAAVERLAWLEPDALWVRLRDRREQPYREVVISDEMSRFVGFRRLYKQAGSRVGRVVLTPDREVARQWQSATDARTGWQKVRRGVAKPYRDCLSCAGQVYDRRSDADLMQLGRDLMEVWKRPDTTVRRARSAGGGVWADSGLGAIGATQILGPVWIGAGRTLDPSTPLIGPAILWDDPAKRPPMEALEWDEIEPAQFFERPVPVRRASSISRAVKRGFDIMFALIALVLTLPLYPFVCLAIWLEDGRPFLFVHRRETTGGREFGCIKFRSMRKDAEKIKQQLLAKNQADGPQFFLADDPRLTRVGRFIRKYNIDELPQLINVLLGHMSIVGPRPSPHRENQYCPPWREARLSVRPGITGLWQIRRTRRAGFDFQEWIKYDLQYVEQANWWLDVKIIWRTFLLLLRGGSHGS